MDSLLPVSHISKTLKECQGFPGGSDSKESVFNAGNPSLIPGLRRSPGGENGNPLQYSCLDKPWTEELGELQSTK